MKTLSILSVILLAIGLVSCDKGKQLKPCKDKKDHKVTYTGICSDGEYEDYQNYDANLTQYVVETLEVDEQDGCVAKGFVKYLESGKTVALVKYGYESTNWATKTLCVNGDCEDKLATWCKFEQPCGTTSPDAE